MIWCTPMAYKNILLCIFTLSHNRHEKHKHNSSNDSENIT